MFDPFATESVLLVQSGMEPGTIAFNVSLFLVEFVVAAALAYTGMSLLERSGTIAVVFAVLYTALVLVVETALGSYWYSFTTVELKAAVYALVYGAVAGFVLTVAVFEPQFDQESEEFWMVKLVRSGIQEANSGGGNSENNSRE